MVRAVGEVVVDVRGLQRIFDTPSGPVEALSHADLHVHAGEVVAVRGPSGSGKSTLMHQIGLLDRPTGGRYLLAGTDTSTLSPRDRAALRARTIGFVLQAFHLVPHKSALQNVALPLVYAGAPRRERRPRAAVALDAVGMSHRASARPGTMSGGEQQRVAVARAVVQRPRLLLCDEPTGNLDQENAARVVALLRAFAADDAMAVLLVTHDPDVAAAADRTVSLRDGRTLPVEAMAADAD